MKKILVALILSLLFLSTYADLAIYQCEVFNDWKKYCYFEKNWEPLDPKIRAIKKHDSDNYINNIWFILLLVLLVILIITSSLLYKIKKASKR